MQQSRVDAICGVVDVDHWECLSEHAQKNIKRFIRIVWGIRIFMAQI